MNPSTLQNYTKRHLTFSLLSFHEETLPPPSLSLSFSSQKHEVLTLKRQRKIQNLKLTQQNNTEEKKELNVSRKAYSFIAIDGT